MKMVYFIQQAIGWSMQLHNATYAAVALNENPSVQTQNKAILYNQVKLRGTSLFHVAAGGITEFTRFVLHRHCPCFPGA